MNNEKTRSFKSSNKSNIILLAVTMFIILIIPEISLQMINPPPEKIGKTDRCIYKTPKAEIYGWACEPNLKTFFPNPDNGEVSYYSRNSEGWKDVEHTYQNPEKKFRILIIGDSMVNGTASFDKIFTRKVEELLKQKGYNNIEVISIGLSAIGTDQVLEILLNEGLKYNPDIFCYSHTSNDIKDNIFPLPTTDSNTIHSAKRFKYILQGDSLVKVHLNPYFSPISEYKKMGFKSSLKHFLLKSALVYNIHRLNVRFRGAKMINISEKDELLLNYLEPLDEYCLFNINNKSQALKDAYNIFEKLILRMKGICNQQDIKFLIFHTTGDTGELEFHLKWKNIVLEDGNYYLTFKGNKYLGDFKLHSNKLDSICRRNDITLIPQKRKYERWDFDPHPNENGNLNMATDIIDYLMEENLLSSVLCDSTDMKHAYQ